MCIYTYDYILGSILGLWTIQYLILIPGHPDSVKGWLIEISLHGSQFNFYNYFIFNVQTIYSDTLFLFDMNFISYGLQYDAVECSYIV